MVWFSSDIFTGDEIGLGGVRGKGKWFMHSKFRHSLVNDATSIMFWGVIDGCVYR